MLKSDVDIERLVNSGLLEIERQSGDLLHIGSGSIDLHLQKPLKKPVYAGTVKVGSAETYPDYEVMDDLVIESGTIALAVTDEYLSIPENLSASIWGRSSIGRLGLFIHNAGFIDPGFEGQLVLELYNPAPYKIEREDGMRICQILIHEYDTDPSFSYEQTGKYQGQQGIMESELYKDNDLE